MYCESRIVSLVCTVGLVLVLGGCKPPVNSAESANTTGPAGITTAFDGDMVYYPLPAGPGPFVYAAGETRLPGTNLTNPSSSCAIEKALSKKTSLFFPEVPLVQVAEYIENQFDIEVVLDHEAMEDYGTAAEDVSITIDVADVSLAAALTVMLKPHELAWTVDHEILVITYAREVENVLSTKVYDVADLVICHDEDGTLWEDYDAIMELIEASIAPETWDMVGGCGSMRGSTFGSGKLLVISQTYQVHQQVEALLRTLKSLARNSAGEVVAPVRKKVKPQLSKSYGNPGSRGSMDK